MKPEWELVEVYRSKEPRTCLCGHTPIIEVCVLQNKATGKVAAVGNHCVKVVLGLPSGRIFQAYRRVRADPIKSLNKEALAHACKMEWITFLEYDFYCGVMRKRKLTPERLELKININKKFIRCMEPSAQPRGVAMAHAGRVDVEEASECSQGSRWLHRMRFRWISSASPGPRMKLSPVS